MGELLAFQQIKGARRKRREQPSGDAEIILFPGVRYMRMEEPMKPPKASRRPARRRARPQKEKAS